MRLLIYIFCFALFSSNISAQNTIRNGTLTYWRVQGIRGGMFLKSKILMSFDSQQSLERLIYVIPPGADDSTTIGEKREIIVNDKGQTVNKTFFSSGPTKARKIDSLPMLFKSYSKKQFLARQVFLQYGSQKEDVYILDEPVPDFGWSITEERKKIGEFECIKAISKPFRGRVYEAWFTPEIPISDGPWKLCGLPGLILEAEDQSKEIRLIFEKMILNPNEINVIKNPFADNKSPRITWEKYVEMVNDRDRKIEKHINSQGGKVTKLEKREWEKTR
jgi:GLPGLI family protein